MACLTDAYREVVVLTNQSNQGCLENLIVFILLFYYLLPIDLLNLLDDRFKCKIT